MNPAKFFFKKNLILFTRTNRDFELSLPDQSHWRNFELSLPMHLTWLHGHRVTRAHGWCRCGTEVNWVTPFVLAWLLFRWVSSRANVFFCVQIFNVFVGERRGNAWWFLFDDATGFLYLKGAEIFKVWND
jgi:hypothetical protein